MSAPRRIRRLRAARMAQDAAAGLAMAAGFIACMWLLGVLRP